MLSIESIPRGTGIENGSGKMECSIFDRTGPTEKNFSGWTELIHSVLDRDF